MKLKKKYKKILIILFLGFCFFIFYKIGAFTIIKEKIISNIEVKHDEQLVNLKDFSYETDEKIPLDVKNVLTNFLDSFYIGMATLKSRNFTSYFSSDKNAYLAETSLKLLSNIRRLQSVDLSMVDVSYSIKVKDIKVSNDNYKIDFLEDYTSCFAFNPSVLSNTYNISSTISINKVDNLYKIVKYNRDEDFYIMLTDNYVINDSSDTTEVKSSLDNLSSKILEDVTVQVNKYKNDLADYNTGKISYSKSCDNSYNRDLAYKYATKYVHQRNVDTYALFDAYGGNCQNFASQVLYAGGIPKDTVGTSIWKYYNDDADQSNRQYGRSTSWSGVDNFYNYAKNNTGYGLCSIVDANIFSAEKGDILQVSQDDNNYAHTVVAIGNVKDDAGNVLDIIINSNTTDRDNYPLSAYNYPYKRLIKILGWNN